MLITVKMVTQTSPAVRTVAANGAITFKASYLDSLAAGDYTITVDYNPMGETYKDADKNVAPGNYRH